MTTEIKGPPHEPKTSLKRVAFEKLCIESNMRKTLSHVEELASAIAGSGWVDPFMVKPAAGGKFVIIQGHRRKMAIQMIRDLVTASRKRETPFKVADLQQMEMVDDTKSSKAAGTALVSYLKAFPKDEPLPFTEVDAQVLDDADAQRAKILQIAENVDREAITPWELATALHDFQAESGATGAKIADLTGKSKSYVNNLLRVAKPDSLHGEIRKALDKGLEMKSDEMVRLAGIEDKETQLKEFKSWLNPNPDETNDPTSESTKKPKKPSPKVQRQYLDGLTLNATLADTVTRQQVRGLMRWMMGEIKNPPKVFKPLLPEKPEKKGKKSKAKKEVEETAE